MVILTSLFTTALIAIKMGFIHLKESNMGDKKERKSPPTSKVLLPKSDTSQISLEVIGKIGELEKQGKYSQALKELEKALVKNPQDFDLKYRKRNLLVKWRKQKLVLSRLRRKIEKSWDLDKTGDYIPALEILWGLQEISPDVEIRRVIERDLRQMLHRAMSHYFQICDLNRADLVASQMGRLGIIPPQKWFDKILDSRFQLMKEKSIKIIVKHRGELQSGLGNAYSKEISKMQKKYHQAMVRHNMLKARWNKLEDEYQKIVKVVFRQDTDESLRDRLMKKRQRLMEEKSKVSAQKFQANKEMLDFQSKIMEHSQNLQGKGNIDIAQIRNRAGHALYDLYKKEFLEIVEVKKAYPSNHQYYLKIIEYQKKLLAQRDEMKKKMEMALR